MTAREDLMTIAFRARRIGVETPWPTFPEIQLLKGSKFWQGFATFLAGLVVFINFLLFAGWSLIQISKIDPFSKIATHTPVSGMANFINNIYTTRSYQFWVWTWIVAGVGSLIVSVFRWGVLKGLTRARLDEAEKHWQAPCDATKTAQHADEGRLQAVIDRFKKVVRLRGGWPGL